ncbi:MAG: PorV/PorQ family protein [Rhodothermales bacterium]|nr:PorV/PorQ family protein [Rhodothermales bacterium]
MNKRMNLQRAYSAILAVLLVSGVGVQDVFGQKSDRAGTAGAYELLIPSTGRNVALGNNTTSGLSTMNGLEALYANPAGLAVNTGTAAMFSRMSYVADIGVNYFGIAQNFGSNNIAFTITNWDFGDIPEQTEIAPQVSNVTWTASYLTAGLSFARQLTDRISAGATVKAVNESIADAKATAIAFDAGMTYVVGETGLRMGVALKNIGNEIQFQGDGLIRSVLLTDQEVGSVNNGLAIESEAVQLPSLLNFGVAYTRSLGAQGSVSFLGNFRSNSFDQDQFSGGVELGFQDLVYVRGGYQLQSDSDLTFFQGATFGAGLNANLGSSRFTVDYAYVPTDFFDAVQVITASVVL